MLGGVQTVFVREIRLWQRFQVASSIETWEGTQVIGRHDFILENGDIAALVMTTAGIYERAARRFVEMAEVISCSELTQPRARRARQREFSWPLTPACARWPRATAVDIVGER